MKRLLIVLALLATGQMAAQDGSLKMYLRGGVNYNTGQLGLDSGLTQGSLIVEGEKPNNGFHFGVSVREFHSNGSYLSLDAGYHETSYDVTFIDPTGQQVTERLQSQAIQVGLSPGIRVFKFIRGQAGINATFEMNDTFEETFNTYKLGYRLGTGLDFGTYSIDVMYLGSFRSTGGEWNGLTMNNATSEYLVGLAIKI